MTAPSYTEDLSDVATGDEASGWAESSAADYDDGGTAVHQDADYPFIQGSYAVSQTCTKTGIAALLYNFGSGITIPTDGALFVWQNFSSPNAIDTYENGGLRVLIGSALDVFYAWYVGGKNFGRMPYGGWQCHAVNPTVSVNDTEGAPSGTQQYLGAAAKIVTGIGKGNPHSVDCIRYGRGSSIFEYGALADGYCTFAGFATQNDNTSYRWGLIQTIPGGYLYKGKMTLGTTSNACDFRDADVNILIDNTPKVTANFNTIEVNNASTRVDWNNVTIKALGTVSPGRLVCNANADLNWTNCQFVGMGAFTLGGTASEILNSIFNGCGAITVAGGKLNGSQVLESTVAANASAVVWDVATNPDGYLDDMIFTKGTNDHHAIEFGTSSPTSITLRGISFSGFSANNSENGSVLHIKRTTGDVAISAVGCSGTVSYKSDGANVTVTVDPVTVQVTAKTASGTVIENVLVFLKASDGTGPFPYQEEVTGIVNSGTTATVTHTGHGMASTDYVLIEGASLAANNGVFQITWISNDSYSYQMTSTPGSSPTGTITSTFVALFGLTGVNGIKSTSRVYSDNQPVTGWARKSSASPFYKTASIIDEIDSSNGLSATAIMLLDS